MKSKVLLESGNDETLVFQVRSDSRNDETHDVYVDKDSGFLCTCEQYFYRKKFCKHMQEVIDFYDSFNEVMHSKTVYHDIQSKR